MRSDRHWCCRCCLVVDEIPHSDQVHHLSDHLASAEWKGEDYVPAADHYIFLLLMHIPSRGIKLLVGTLDSCMLQLEE